MNSFEQVSATLQIPLKCVATHSCVHGEVVSVGQEEVVAGEGGVGLKLVVAVETY